MKASKFVGRVPCSKERTLSVRFEKNDVLGDVDCSRIVSAAYGLNGETKQELEKYR